MHSQTINLPTAPQNLQATLIWLETHKNEAFAPRGIRYLQLKNTAQAIGMPDEFEAYLNELPKLLVRFRAAASAIECDLVIECPSCESHAARFATTAAMAHPDAMYLVLGYDCKNENRPRAGREASVQELAMAIFPKSSPMDLNNVRKVLIVDDVFNDGKTAAAVTHKLWEWGLDRNAAFCVAVALRVMPSQPTRKINLIEVLKPNGSPDPA